MFLLVEVRLLGMVIDYTFITSAGESLFFFLPQTNFNRDFIDEFVRLHQMSGYTRCITTAGYSISSQIFFFVSINFH